MHAGAIFPPALTTRQPVNALVAEARAARRNLPGTLSKRRRALGLVRPILGGTGQLRQLGGTSAAPTVTRRHPIHLAPVTTGNREGRARAVVQQTLHRMPELGFSRVSRSRSTVRHNASRATRE